VNVEAKLPDREAVVVAALKSRSSITALTTAVGTRLVTGLCVQVTLLGGSSRPLRNTGAPEFQLAVWGGGNSPADEAAVSDLAGTVESELTDLSGSYGPGRVLGSWLVGDLLHTPDETTARERYIITAGALIQP
jgi:hypothetical protein